MQKQRWALMVLVGLLLLAVTAPAMGQSGEVVVYTSVPLPLATKFAEAFQAAHPGIRVNLFRSGATEVVQRIWAEAEAGRLRADVIWLADAAVFYTFRDRGLLAAYRSPEAAVIPAELKDPDGYFTAARIINIIMAVNTGLVRAGQEPRTWQDFLEFGPRAVMGNPLYSGSNFTTAAAFVHRDGGWNWFEQARRNGVVVVQGNSEATLGVVSGEFAVAMTLDYMVYAEQQRGAPVRAVWPVDGAVSIPSPIAVGAQAPNPEAARRFVDFVLSREGQAFMAEDGVIPVRPDVAAPPGQPAPDQIKMIPIPFEWAAENAAQIRQTFERIMLQ